MAFPCFREEGALILLAHLSNSYMCIKLYLNSQHCNKTPAVELLPVVRVLKERSGMVQAAADQETQQI